MFGPSSMYSSLLYDGFVTTLVIVVITGLAVVVTVVTFFSPSLAVLPSGVIFILWIFQLHKTLNLRGWMLFLL